MADNKLLQQMLESLVNDEQAKAEELFHEYVVAASREIYESLIDSEIAEEEEKEEEEMEEASEDEDAEEDKVEENFGQFEGEDDSMDLDAADPTDDLAGELGGEEEPMEKGEEELFQDLEAIVDELQAKFDELKGIESDEHGDEFGGEMGDEEEAEEGFELATVREYVEKVANGHGAEKKGAGEGALVGTGAHSQGSSTSAKSVVAGKNDMGGTAANIVAGGTEQSPVEAGKGQLKGNGLLKGNVVPNPDAAGNVNVPGGNAGKTGFKKKEPGHGAEKKGEAPGKLAGAGTGETGGQRGEQSTGSLFRGRR